MAWTNKQREFFVLAETDEVYTRIEEFVKRPTARKALEDFVSQFPSLGGDSRHIFPLHFADLYENSDAYHRGKRPLATLYKKNSEWYKKNAAAYKAFPIL